VSAEEKRVLFVCEGNICRSPMAEWLANATLPGVRAASAGLKPGGKPMTPHSLTVLKERLGVDASAHASRNIGEVAAEAFDTIVALHPYIASRLKDEHAITADIVWEVPDPIGAEIAGYRATYAQIERAMAGFLQAMEAS
jgi:protein-tyrosine phosphatase